MRRFCDQGYETDNGCLAHSGGANPTKHILRGRVGEAATSASIDDNSTGLMGIRAEPHHSHLANQRLPVGPVDTRDLAQR